MYFVLRFVVDSIVNIVFVVRQTKSSITPTGSGGACVRVRSPEEPLLLYLVCLLLLLTSLLLSDMFVVLAWRCLVDCLLFARGASKMVSHWVRLEL